MSVKVHVHVPIGPEALKMRWTRESSILVSSNICFPQTLTYANLPATLETQSARIPTYTEDRNSPVTLELVNMLDSIKGVTFLLPWWFPEPLFLVLHLTSFDSTHVCLYMLVFTCCHVCIGERMPSDNKLDCPRREEVLIQIQIRE